MAFVERANDHQGVGYKIDREKDPAIVVMATGCHIRGYDLPFLTS